MGIAATVVRMGETRVPDGRRTSTDGDLGRGGGAARVLRRVAAAVATLLVVNLLWLLWAGIDEAAVPSWSAVPEPPAGASVVERGVDCGSGGCWREVVLDTGDRPVADVAAQLDVERERCRPVLPLPRRLCVSSSVAAPHSLVLYARYGW